jgi:hypothetical protein
MIEVFCRTVLWKLYVPMFIFHFLLLIGKLFSWGSLSLEYAEYYSMCCAEIYFQFSVEDHSLKGSLVTL